MKRILIVAYTVSVSETIFEFTGILTKNGSLRLCFWLTNAIFYYSIVHISLNVTVLLTAILYIPMIIVYGNCFMNLKKCKPQMYVFWQIMAIVVFKIGYLPSIKAVIYTSGLVPSRMQSSMQIKWCCSAHQAAYLNPKILWPEDCDVRHSGLRKDMRNGFGIGDSGIS
ncbi:hypothetical protein CRE_20851 [Caenorhabditis remanei]|uniref:Uncharacterized protein n=1 Tax=Caenorhabditis remanei TaxID=31234 RepID=E3MV51_CAERE|nr:hypothetical protein CRE_20851 [Caenorhabditis remanei]